MAGDREDLQSPRLWPWPTRSSARPWRRRRRAGAVQVQLPTGFFPAVEAGLGNPVEPLILGHVAELAANQADLMIRMLSARGASWFDGDPLPYCSPSNCWMGGGKEPRCGSRPIKSLSEKRRGLTRLRLPRSKIGTGPLLPVDSRIGSKWSGSSCLPLGHLSASGSGVQIPGAAGLRSRIKAALRLAAEADGGRGGTCAGGYVAEPAALALLARWRSVAIRLSPTFGKPVTIDPRDILSTDCCLLRPAEPAKQSRPLCVKANRHNGLISSRLTGSNGRLGMASAQTSDRSLRAGETF